jgi:hypothetical protein
VSDTPRTDAATMYPVANNGLLKTNSGYIDNDGVFVFADFARQLERDLTAAQKRVAELEAANEHLLLEDGLMTFYQTNEQLKAEQAAHLATRRALVDSVGRLPSGGDDRQAVWKLHSEAIYSARSKLAVEQAETKPVIKQSLTTEPEPRTCGECAVDYFRECPKYGQHRSSGMTACDNFQPRADAQKGGQS